MAQAWKCDICRKLYESDKNASPKSTNYIERGYCSESFKYWGEKILVICPNCSQAINDLIVARSWLKEKEESNDPNKTI